MDKQNEQEQSSLTKVVTALQDLARLSLHGDAAVTERTASVASALLERLLTLCQASQGVIFLSTPSPADAAPVFPTAATSTTVLRRLALSGANEAEIPTVVLPLPSESFWISPPSRGSSWLHWQIPLLVSLPPQQRDEKDDQRKVNALPALYALVLLGWHRQEKEAHNVLIKKACAVLPSLTDAVGTVIVRMLSNEYINELEASTDQKALHEMDLLKAELLATVSHELRSPLASIKGYAATLLRHERRISREERHEFLLAIHEASDRLAAVIDALLEMSELQTGVIELERTSIDIVRLVREAVIVAQQHLEYPEASANSLASAHRQPTFTVHLEAPNEELSHDKLIVEADQRHLREVLDHLLKNAITHIPEDGIIDVTLWVASSSDDFKPFSVFSAKTVTNITRLLRRVERVVVIAVHDDGAGIAPQHLTRIFEPFYRVDTRLTRETNGLGLGLAICRRIIELHEGLLWVESEFERGSTFFVCLPQESTTPLGSRASEIERVV